MGKVIILPETTKNPISLIGERAGVCWGADTTDAKNNFKRGLDCIESDHGRTLEYVNVEMILDGFSARVIREWYTHIGGSPTRLQASTRYIDYSKGSGFDYVIPPSIQTDIEGYDMYQKAMKNINNVCAELIKKGLPREDVAMLLPLGMCTKIVDKRNLRNLVDMSHQRMCSRAYWEFRLLFDRIMSALSNYSNEWNWIINNLFKRKCDSLGRCPEKKSCGYYDKKMSRNGACCSCEANSIAAD